MLPEPKRVNSGGRFLVFFVVALFGIIANFGTQSYASGIFGIVSIALWIIRSLIQIPQKYEILPWPFCVLVPIPDTGSKQYKRAEQLGAACAFFAGLAGSFAVYEIFA